MPPDRNADPAAMAARIKELEAAQAAAPPVSPLVRLWAIAGEVLGMFPKWLLVAALAVFLAFHAFSYYQQAQQQAAETMRIQNESEKSRAGLDSVPLDKILTGEPIPGEPRANQPTPKP